MSIYGAFYAGVSGLAAQSNAMGIISDNIANVNTVGYKGTVARFSTIVAHSGLENRYAPGGVMSFPLSNIDKQGQIRASDSPTDLAVAGRGMFVVSDRIATNNDTQFMFTRAGSFRADKQGNLRNTAGQFLRGYPIVPGGGAVPNGAGTFAGLQTVNVHNLAGKVEPTTEARMSLNLPSTGKSPVASTGIQQQVALNNRAAVGAGPSTGVDLGNFNLDSRTAAGGEVRTTTEIYDSRGNSHNVTTIFTKTAVANEWTVRLDLPEGVTARGTTGTGTFTGDPTAFTFAPELTFDGDFAGIAPQTLRYDLSGATQSANATRTPTSTQTGGNKAYRVKTPIYDSLGKSYDLTTVYTKRVAAGPSTGVDLGAFNLDSRAAVGTGVTRTTAIYDSEGNSHSIRTTFTRTAIGWDINTVADTGVTIQTGTGTGTLTNAGVLTFTPPVLEFSAAAGGAARQPLTYDISGVTQNAAATTTAETSTQVGGSATSEWDVSLETPPGVTIAGGNSTGRIVFDRATGLPTALPTLNPQLTFANGAARQTVAMNLGEVGSGTGLREATGNSRTQLSTQTGGTLPSEHKAPIQVYDNLGNTHQVDIKFRKTGPNRWTIQAENPTLNGQQSGTIISAAREITFRDGIPVDTEIPPLAITWNDDIGAADSNVALNVGRQGQRNGVTQFANSFNINEIEQNGVAFGAYRGVKITEDGVVQALFTNGEQQDVYQLALGTFPNVNGLQRRNGNSYNQSDDSGDFLLKQPGTGGAGKVAASSLETSNIDLAGEFTNMITTQRAYSASSKIITTADEMLEELIRVVR